MKRNPMLAFVQADLVPHTYDIVEIFKGKEQMEPVVKKLCSRDRSSWAVEMSVSRSEYALTSFLTQYDSTHKPALCPTASMNPQATCRCRSSRAVDCLPRCRAESAEISLGVKYGL